MIRRMRLPMHGEQFLAFARDFRFPWLRAGFLFLLYAGALAFESLAVSLFVPILLFFERKGDVPAMTAESRGTELLFDAMMWLGLPTSLGMLMGMAFAAILLRQAGTYGRILYGAYLQEEVLSDIRTDLYRRYSQVHTGFQENLRIGGFINGVVVEARSAVSSLMLFIDLSALVLTIVIYIAMMGLISAPMTLLVVALVALVAISMRGLMLKMVQTSRNATTANAELMGFLSERLAASRLIRLSGMERVESSEMQTLSRMQMNTIIELRRIGARSEVLVDPIIAGLGFGLIYAAYMYLSMPLATIGVFLFILLRMMPVAKSFVTLRQNILSRIGSLEVVRALSRDLDAHREPVGGSLEFNGLQEAIRFDHVSFTYPSAADPALSDISLSLMKGQVTAVVGPSGSGKSTLVDLLPRLRDPDAGRITVDQVALEEFSVASLRRGIAYASQAAQIFDISVADHVGYGSDTRDETHLRRALRLAGAEGFVDALPLGMQSRLGQAGAQFSGGQLQRLDLARVIAADAPVMILDEPTSHLDAESENAFRRALQHLRSEGNATILIVAHRLHMIDWVDQIVVLRNGQIEARGRHQELLESSAWYRQAYSRENDGVDKAAAVAAGAGDQ